MKSINRTLDAAILKPEMNEAEVRAALETCLALEPATVCVRPCDIELAQSYCQGTDVGVCVVLGFPHGAQLSASKVDEARRYVAMGVDEIDMVVNIGWVRSAAWDKIEAEIRAIVEVTKNAEVPLKVIFESCLLTLEEVASLTEVCIRAGADFVKTSTGFNGPGANDEAVRTMLETARGRIEVKPSGGIRDRKRAEALLSMGATRLGVGFTSVADIVTGEPGSDAPAGAY